MAFARIEDWNAARGHGGTPLGEGLKAVHHSIHRGIIESGTTPITEKLRRELLCNELTSINERFGHDAIILAVPLSPLMEPHVVHSSVRDETQSHKLIDEILGLSPLPHDSTGTQQWGEKGGGD